MKLQNKLWQLEQEKAKRESRRPSLLHMMDETGIGYSALHSWKHNRPSRLDDHIILKLCAYFQCTPGELIIIVEDEDLPEIETPALA